MINDNFEIETIELTEELKENFSNIISLLGEKITREGLIKTPERASKAMKFLTSGYAADPKQILEGAMFKEEYKELVIVKNI